MSLPGGEKETPSPRCEGMLEGLDKIDWSELAHAYGAADDVPDLLRSLASADSDERENAFHELYGNIWHQGTVYAATVQVVPFLLELLESPKVESKDQILVLLAHLARGGSRPDVHQHSPSLEDNAAEQSRQDEIHNAVEKAVTSGESLYVAFLNEPDAALRDSTAYLLASLPISAKRADAVWRRIEKENEERVLVSLLLAFGSVAERSQTNVSALLGILVGAGSKSIKLAIAMSLVRLSPSEPCGDSVAILVEAAQSPEGYETLVESIWSQIDDFDLLVMNHLA